MDYKIEIQTIREPYGEYHDEWFGRNIVFDFHLEYSFNPFKKDKIGLFPESFSNWSNGSQEKLTVYEYIKVIKRIMSFLKQEYPKYYITIES